MLFHFIFNELRENNKDNDDDNIYNEDSVIENKHRTGIWSSKLSYRIQKAVHNTTVYNIEGKPNQNSLAI